MEECIVALDRDLRGDIYDVERHLCALEEEQPNLCTCISEALLELIVITGVLHNHNIQVSLSDELQEVVAENSTGFGIAIPYQEASLKSMRDCSSSYSAPFSIVGLRLQDLRYAFQHAFRHASEHAFRHASANIFIWSLCLSIAFVGWINSSFFTSEQPIYSSIHNLLILSTFCNNTDVALFQHEPDALLQRSAEVLVTSLHWLTDEDPAGLMISYMFHGIIMVEGANVDVYPYNPTLWLHYSSISADVSLSDDCHFFAVSNLVTGFDVYSIDSEEPINSLHHGVDADEAFPTPMCFVHSGYALLTGSTVGNVQLWAASSGRPHQSLFTGKKRKVLVIAMFHKIHIDNPDYDRFLITTSSISSQGGSNVTVWRAQKLDQLQNFCSPFTFSREARKLGLGEAVLICTSAIILTFTIGII
ncbi:hypothetical protein NM688_g1757 [Phlebia brevispora]|uniref:Uncharacterized protein n=1 Tax=Phlebia brevispora TaxID=194682 RepID=A0ACC1TAS8_9APHY|nr:hypothetical protein NM688_g1757 [Phlebia brevispora]